MELAKIQRDRAVDAVYQAIRQGIFSRLFQPGERLHVDDLAGKLGVSLTPVRQAIQQLAAEGLVEVRPRNGTFVARLSSQDVEETFEIRCALECLAAEKAVQRITPEELSRLRELLAVLREPVANEADRREHERNNSEFHLILLAAAGNRRLLEMYEGLNSHLKIARIHRVEDNWLSRLPEEQAEHEEIVAALEERNASRLAQALRRHINRAKESLLKSLRESVS